MPWTPLDLAPVDGRRVRLRGVAGGAPPAREDDISTYDHVPHTRGYSILQAAVYARTTVHSRRRARRAGAFLFL